MNADCSNALCLFQMIDFQLKSVECNFVSIATSSIKTMDISGGEILHGQCILCLSVVQNYYINSLKGLDYPFRLLNSY